MGLIIPQNYKPLLGVKDTEKAIRLIKEFFQTNLSAELNLIRATAPLFVKAGTGINDDLNGIEKPVSFEIKCDNNAKAEIVQSLAKWKRMALQEYGLTDGEGLYTDMNAIRSDEDLDNLHSLYVDQWDWERVLKREDRNVDFLKTIVKKIYKVVKGTEYYVASMFPEIKPFLPDEITFIHAEDLLNEYPNLSSKDREKEACKKFGAIFVIGIGNPLITGEPHDGRAADYDDWVSETKPGYNGLNGDIIVYNPVLDVAYELSSMGIRVDEVSLLKQLEIRNQMFKKDLMFHKRLLSKDLPLSIGGGIGQSRLCMFFLRKAHIGEVQVSLWPEQMKETLKNNNIFLF